MSKRFVKKLISSVVAFTTMISYFPIQDTIQHTEQSAESAFVYDFNHPDQIPESFRAYAEEYETESATDIMTEYSETETTTTEVSTTQKVQTTTYTETVRSIEKSPSSVTKDDPGSLWNDMQGSLGNADLNKDFNNDGVINGFDAILAKRYALSAQQSVPQIYFSGEKVYDNQNLTLNLNIENNCGFTDLALHVYYPSAITPVLDSTGNPYFEKADFLSNSSVSTYYEGDLCCITIYISNSKAITEDGKIMSLLFSCNANGDYSIFTNIEYMINGRKELSSLAKSYDFSILQHTTVTTTTTTTTTTTQPIWNGIDVSRWNGEINWTAVKNAGYKYVIIRAGYGKYASQKDAMFDKNITGAKAAGLYVGVYWYSYAMTAAEAVQEANVCLSIIKGYQLEYPVAFDIEEADHLKLPVATIDSIINGFCSTIEKAGYYTAIYSFYSFFLNNMSASTRNKYDLFVAHINVNSSGIANCGIWQYSWVGKVNGISGDVDLSYSYRDYPALMKKYHLNGY